MNRAQMLLPIAVAACLFSSGCAGHQGGTPLPPTLQPASSANAPRASDKRSNAFGLPMPVEANVPKGKVTLNISFDTKRGVNLFNFYPRLKSPHAHARLARKSAGDFKQIEVSGSIWPSYASINAVSNIVFVAPPKKGNVVSATDTFTNVPKGNNEFAVFAIYGVASDGSTTFLGSLATIVNVGTSSQINVTANVPSTLVFQAAQAMIEGGELSAADLMKKPTLANTVRGYLKALKLKPDKQTGLLNDGSLTRLVKTEMTALRRTLVPATSATAQYLTVANDASSYAENALLYNEGTFLVGNFYGYRPYGAPCSSFSRAHVPGVRAKLWAYSCATYFNVSPPNSAPPLYVYGGPLIVGQVNFAYPYTGSISKEAALAAGSTMKVTLPALQPRVRNITTNDPQDWAYGFAGYPEMYRASAQGTGYVTPGPYYDWAYFRPGGWSAGSPIIPVMTWNPWGVPASQFQICSWNSPVISTPNCLPLTSNGTLAVNPPFYDFGNNKSYFNWAGSGVTLAAEPTGTCTFTNGYQISYTGTTFSITTHTKTWLAPGQLIEFYFDPSSSTCTGVSFNASATINATGADGRSYVNAGFTFFDSFYGYVPYVYMNSVTHNTQINSMTITFSNMPSGGPVDLDDMYYPYYYYVSAIQRKGNFAGLPVQDQRRKLPSSTTVFSVTH